MGAILLLIVGAALALAVQGWLWVRKQRCWTHNPTDEELYAVIVRHFRKERRKNELSEM